jgi:hypothetical protein
VVVAIRSSACSLVRTIGLLNVSVNNLLIQLLGQDVGEELERAMKRVSGEREGKMCLQIINQPHQSTALKVQHILLPLFPMVLESG